MADSAWIFHSVDRPWPDGYTFNNFTRLPWDSVEYATPGRPAIQCVADSYFAWQQVV